MYKNRTLEHSSFFHYNKSLNNTIFCLEEKKKSCCSKLKNRLVLVFSKHSSRNYPSEKHFKHLEKIRVVQIRIVGGLAVLVSSYRAHSIQMLKKKLVHRCFLSESSSRLSRILSCYINQSAWCESE